MEYVFNSITDKYPQGACKVGSSVTYSLRVSRNVECKTLYIVVLCDIDNTIRRIKMPLHSSDEDYLTFSVTINFDTAGLFWYHFVVKNPTHTVYLCKTQLFDIEPKNELGASFAQVVYKKPSSVEKNYRTGVMYHVFVDRFKKSGAVVPHKSMHLRKDWCGAINKNSNDYLVINKEAFGGNLQGVIDKLSYIKDLGVSTIYLSPIFESYSYHKYDAADLSRVDSMLGGDQVFKTLVKEAKKLGLGILLDGVFNHVGSDSIYFNKMDYFDDFGAYQSKKSKYYDWFHFEEFPDKYSSWWGIDTLPKFNENNVALQKFIAGTDGIIAKHMKTGIMGFRLDVVDEIADVFLDKICAAVKSVKPDGLVLGEVWEDAATKIAYSKRRHYFRGNQLDGVMNYPLKNGILDFVLHANAENLASTFFMLKDHYPINTQNNLMNFLGTHDTKRILTILQESNKGNPITMLKIASAIQYCAPGVPAVFYGDEVGITGGDAPYCRMCFPWGRENKEILAWYKKLGKLRAMDIFAEGACNVVFFGNGVFVFERKHKNDRVVIAANCGGEDFQLNLENPMLNFEENKLVKDFVLLKYNSFVILLNTDSKKDGKNDNCKPPVRKSNAK
ncbi:MAG: glycoside hydrolase family 13 protein [Firmicutes bacterium]|nr:glycoside hydrolase family 13 protein [Bacillota bacterium]